MQTGIYKLLSFFLILLTGLIYLVSSIDQNKASPAVQAVPCVKPDTYHIGEIDNRYSISEQELFYLLREVAEIWSDAYGQPVMEYADDGDIRVNLVYAEQQELSDRERQFRGRIQSERYRINSVEKEYQLMDSEYMQRVQQHQDDMSQLQEKVVSLNRWVSEKNEQGGFTESEMPLFEERKNEIDSLTVELNRRNERLNEAARNLNRKVERINEKVNQKNSLIEEYNQTFSGTRRFTQGSYERRGNERSINVYSFLDEDELMLVLAHEMGHALGIGHVDNPQSVMYRLMGNQARPGLKLTEDDRHALMDICSNTDSSEWSAH